MLFYQHLLRVANASFNARRIIMLIELKKKSLSFLDLSTHLLHPIMYSIMGYVLYLLNIQQKEQLKVILQLQETNALQQHKIAELTASISRLREIIEAQEKVKHAIINQVNLDALIAANDMTQFYIKTVGVVIACVIVASALSNFGLINYSQGKFLQDYTSLFRESKSLTFYDSPTRTDWYIEIANNRTIESIKVRPVGRDLMGIEDYLSLIFENIESSADAAQVIASDPMLAILAEATTTYTSGGM
jgi:hypothetical protein